MRIAIATDGDHVSQHFGRCPAFTLVDIENSQVRDRTVIPAPEHRPHYLPRFLHEKGVEQIIAGGMGRNARALFERFRIGTFIGVDETVNRAIDLFLRGELTEGENGCDSGEHHHEHHHHHHSHQSRPDSSA